MKRLPEPIPGESLSDFISRFISDPEALLEFPDSELRFAVAEAIYYNTLIETT